MQLRFLLILLLAPGSSAAEMFVATHTIRAQSVLTHADLMLSEGEAPGSTDDPSLLIGRETRVALYAGRPVRPADLTTPAIIERNQIVRLVLHNGGLRIITEGRALARAAPGDIIRVMNISSKITVSGQVSGDGQVHVVQ